MFLLMTQDSKVLSLLFGYMYYSNYGIRFINYFQKLFTCIHFLAIVNCAKHIEANTSLMLVILVSLGIFLEERFLGHIIILSRQ